MNRVLVGIERQRQTIQDRLDKGLTTKEAVDRCNASLDLLFDEFISFQETKSLSYLQGKLNLEEAQTLYNLLGETPDHFNQQPVEVKAVLTKVFAELLAMKLTGV